jgi:hypothetical protein
MLLAVVVLVQVGCAEARPDPDRWYEDWQAVLAAMPTIDELGVPPDAEVCNDALGVLRATPDDLLPTPDPATDGPVREWLQIAEGVVFECELEAASVGPLDEAYAELALLEAEIDASLGR